ncbi:MAG: phosphotransferase [Pseudomonadota bacterium]
MQTKVDVSTFAGYADMVADVLGELPGIGTQIVHFEAGRHLSGSEFVQHLDQVIRLLQAFHRSGPLAGSFNVHRVVEAHARDSSRFGISEPDAFPRLCLQSSRIEQSFAVSPTPVAACHNDLLAGNVLFGDTRAWLLDYEYAGNNDPFFDLANLSVNANLDHDGDEKLLMLYFGGTNSARWARLQLMKMMSEFREGMWGAVQQAISTIDEDFAAYTVDHLARAEHLVDAPEFSQWLVDARDDPRV